MQDRKYYDRYNIDKIIEKSHVRSEAYGIEKERISSKRILKKEEFCKNIKDNKELLNISVPFIKKIYEVVNGSGFLLILTDKDGCILNIIGDKKMLNEAKSMDMIIGAYMDEKSIGTNAMGTAISENMPIQISAKEHFINAYHNWTCSAAPIHDEKNNIIGTLNLTGLSEKVHPHTLGLVVAAVNSIENELKNRHINKKLIEAYEYMNVIMDAISYGIIAVSSEGIIKDLNKSACRIFNLKKDQCINKDVNNFLDNWNEILKKCESKEVYKEVDVLVKIGENKERYSEIVYPIEDEEGNLIGVVVTVKEIQRIFNLVNKYTGMNARYTFEDLICQDKQMQRIIQFAKNIAPSPSTVLIQGESGTGKEVLAQSIHNYSDRREGPFVAINCGAIPKNLIESELFGYEEGTFTGARKGGKPGKFELANGGTLFLDEIGEMPLDMQVNLLRVLQERCVTRIGGSKYIPINVRIIVATNKDLKNEIQKGRFRSDLYYRISVIPIYMPALRDRKDDITVLLQHFLKIKSQKLNKSIPYISEELYEKIINYNWPGNVRELDNFVENLVNLGGSSWFNVQSINMNNDTERLKVENNNVNYICSLEELEKRAIIACLMEFKGNISKCSSVLGISRNTLYTKIKKYNVNF